ncbi:MAG: enoyl-CoA hydratase [bacterium]|nr:enoyl-CoA hydratase [bacterium]
MGYVTIEKPKPHVSVIRLNRPDRLNPLSFDTVAPLYEAIEEVGNDNDCWVAVLTGTGRGFCSGLDLEDHGVPPNIEGLKLSRIAISAMEYMSNLVPALRKMQQPVIAAINGPAYGGGMCLCLGADIRLAARSAVFRNAAINNGLSGTELGISFLLPRAIGASRAWEIILSGREVGADEAERIGLVSRTVDDERLMSEALSLAEGICDFSSHGVFETKKVLWSNLEGGSLAQAIDLENRNQLLVRLTTNNLDEAIRARKEKRKPLYED